MLGGPVDGALGDVEAVGLVACAPGQHDEAAVHAADLEQAGVAAGRGELLDERQSLGVLALDGVVDGQVRVFDGLAVLGLWISLVREPQGIAPQGGTGGAPPDLEPAALQHGRAVRSPAEAAVGLGERGGLHGAPRYHGCYRRAVTRGAGSFVVSLDFELYWGMRDVISLEDYRAHLEGVHEVVPRLLDLFERFGVHATWATVGLVFAENQEEARAFAPQLRPSYDDPRLSPYGALDRPGLDRDAACYFAPTLVQRIAQSPHQELASHSYAHYYCVEPGQTRAQFEADLQAAAAIAETRGVRLRSLVFPRNQVNRDYLPVLRDRGITAYRGVPGRWALQRGRSRLDTWVRRGVRLADNYMRLHDGAIDVPRPAPDDDDPIDLPGTRFLRPYASRLRKLEPAKLARIEGEMTEAATAGHAYHLWWHPHNFGRDPEPNLKMLEHLLEHARRLTYSHGWQSRTMAELADHVRVSF